MQKRDIAVRDGRIVYLDGKIVDDVSTHPAYRNAVASAGALYGHQAKPENVERMTFDVGGGRRVNGFDIEAGGGMHGDYYLPNKNLLYAAQVQSQEMYPGIITAIRELAGGSLLMLPSSAADFDNPDVARIIALTQVSPAMTGGERVKLLKLAWDAVGSEFASRHLQYEMFYAGAQFVTRGHSFRTYDWDGAGAIATKVMSGYDLSGTKGR